MTKKLKANKLISLKEIEHFLKLARIEISENEKEQLQDEVSKILDYVGQLKEVDTSKIDEISQITGLENVSRQDLVFDTEGTPEKIIQAFPNKDGRFLKVKEVFSSK